MKLSLDWLWRKIFKSVVEDALEDLLTKVQDELSAKLEKEYKVPAAITSELFWQAIQVAEDRLNMDLEDQTPGK